MMSTNHKRGKNSQVEDRGDYLKTTPLRDKAVCQQLLKILQEKRLLKFNTILEVTEECTQDKYLNELLEFEEAHIIPFQYWHVVCLSEFNLNIFLEKNSHFKIFIIIIKSRSIFDHL